MRLKFCKWFLFIALAALNIDGSSLIESLPDGLCETCSTAVCSCCLCASENPNTSPSIQDDDGNIPTAETISFSDKTPSDAPSIYPSIKGDEDNDQTAESISSSTETSVGAGTLAATGAVSNHTTHNILFKY